MFQLKRSSNGTQEPFTQCHNPGPSNITCGLYPSFDRCSSFQRIDKTEKACLGIFLATVVKTVGMSKKQNSDEFSLNKTTECKFLFRPILAFQKVPKEKVPTNSQRMTHYRNNMQEFCGSWVFRSTALEGFGSEASVCSLGLASKRMTWSRHLSSSGGQQLGLRQGNYVMYTRYIVYSLVNSLGPNAGCSADRTCNTIPKICSQLLACWFCYTASSNRKGFDM